MPVEQQVLPLRVGYLAVDRVQEALGQGQPVEGLASDEVVPLAPVVDFPRGRPDRHRLHESRWPVPAVRQRRLQEIDRPLGRCGRSCGTHATPASLTTPSSLWDWAALSISMRRSIACTSFRFRMGKGNFDLSCPSPRPLASCHGRRPRWSSHSCRDRPLHHSSVEPVETDGTPCRSRLWAQC